MTTYYIYKICCCDDSTNEFYIGSTVNITVRKYQHKTACNGNKLNQKIYTTIRQNGNWENWRMCVIQQIPNCSKIEARIREEELRVELGAVLNSNRAYNELTLAERSREYKDQNKEAINERQKVYYQNNKEKINEKSKEKFNCGCGGRYTKTHEKRHKSSQKHLNYIQNNI